MSQFNWLWWLIAGILIGWLASTLIEWLWFRRKRMELRDERIADLEDALSNMVRSGDAAEPAEPSFVAPPSWATPAAASSPAGAPPPMPTTSRPQPPAPPAEPQPVPAHGSAPAQPPRAADVAEPEATAELEAEQDAVALEIEPELELENEEPPPQVVELAADRPALKPAATLPASAIPPPSAPDEEEPKPKATFSQGKAAAPRPAAPPMRPDHYPDDLTAVSGIGRAYEQRLYEAGIFTWHQIASLEPAKLKTLAKARQTANVEQWPSLAQALAVEHRRVGAIYHGPPPDRFSEITGIGEANEKRLYRSGIFTYTQLAQLSVAELERIIPPNKAGTGYDLTIWIEQAAQLANT